jgi:hypothetical protein
VAANAVMEAWAGGLDREVVVDLLDALLADDVDPVDLLDGLVCATAQLLVEAELEDEATALQTLTGRGGVGGPRRTARWALAAGGVPAGGPRRTTRRRPTCPASCPPRASRSSGQPPAPGRAGLLTAGLSCLEALAATFGEAGRLPREVALAMPLPVALVDHDLLRRPGDSPRS